MRQREAISPEAKVLQILRGSGSPTTAARLAERLLSAGLIVGTRAPLLKRIGELLETLEQAGSLERVRDGRYRAVPQQR
jgi:hypothetical protein